MIISVWRYSHLALAISSFLLLIVASVSGIFLAAEPVIDQSKGFRTEGFDTATLAQVVPMLKEKHPGIQELTVDDNEFVVMKYATGDGDQQAYVNPLTGEILGVPAEKQPLFQWMTTLHRSLFLHETGRILVGITAFLLILIAISGVLLVVHRQQGWKRFFAPVEKTSLVQYYHVVFGRLSLVFILAIALTGTYLAVYRLVPPPAKASLAINEENIKEEPLKPVSAFPLLQQTPLSRLQKLQYPFSEFPEDYFNVQLKDKEVCLNQFTGEVLAEVAYTRTYQLAQFSLRWHTGRSGTVWSLILAITSAYLLFFIYSGFAITLKRRRNRSANKYKAAEARIIILVGSENGSTFAFANAIYKQLLKHGEKAFVTDINNYTTYPQATHLIVMASTYGQGEAPSNAKKLAEKISRFPQVQPIQYSIVGFGSRSYAQFCKFAYTVEALLQNTTWARAITPVYTVDEKSPQDFGNWLTAWTAQTGFALLMPRELLAPHLSGLHSFSVSHRTAADAEATFTIRLRSRRLRQAASGDLLAIYPKNDHRERLYSIGKIDKEIQLSVKLHEHGLGSHFLNGLKPGDKLRGRLVKNQHFRFPEGAKKVIMVSNGTGIAPFLGMISENKKKIPIELYGGFRNRSSFALFDPFLQEQVAAGKLQTIHLCLSREGGKEYVSHRILKDRLSVWHTLRQGGVIMICGSLSMHHDVMNALTEIVAAATGDSAAAFVENGQIMADCY